jgi:hypothetical protein
LSCVAAAILSQLDCTFNNSDALKTLQLLSTWGAPEKFVGHHCSGVCEAIGVEVDHLHHFRCVSHLGEVERYLELALAGPVERGTKPVPHLQLIKAAIKITCKIGVRVIIFATPRGLASQKRAADAYRGSPDRSRPTTTF